MVEKLESKSRREFISNAAATTVVLAAAPIIGATEALAERKKWLDLEDVIDLDVPYPEDWQERLGGKKSGVVVNKEAGVFWFFKNGKVIRSGPVLTADPVAFDTPEGLYHFSWQAGANYKSSEYRVKMPYPTFIDAKNDEGEQRGIAFHASPKLRKARDGKVQIRGKVRNLSNGDTTYEINTSHGCMNLLPEDALFLQQQLRIKKGDPSSHYPVYIMAADTSLQEDVQKELLKSIDHIEQIIAQSEVLKHGSETQVSELLQEIPQSPSVLSLRDDVAREVYSSWRHASGDSADLSRDPVMRLRSENRWDSKEGGQVIGNTVRVGNIKALTTAHILRDMTGDTAYDELLKSGINAGTITHRGFFAKRHRDTVPIQTLTELNNEGLNGKWSEAYGYGYDREGGWSPLRTGGVVLDIKTNKALKDMIKTAFVAQGSNAERFDEIIDGYMLFVTPGNLELEEGTMISTRVSSGTFEFSAIVSNSLEIEGGLTACLVHGPDVLRSVISKGQNKTPF